MRLNSTLTRPKISYSLALAHLAKASNKASTSPFKSPAFFHVRPDGLHENFQGRSDTLEHNRIAMFPKLPHDQEYNRPDVLQMHVGSAPANAPLDHTSPLGAQFGLSIAPQMVDQTSLAKTQFKRMWTSISCSWAQKGKSPGDQVHVVPACRRPNTDFEEWAMQKIYIAAVPWMPMQTWPWVKPLGPELGLIGGFAREFSVCLPIPSDEVCRILVEFHPRHMSP